LSSRFGKAFSRAKGRLERQANDEFAAATHPRAEGLNSATMQLDQAA
jgi:hypothetical protein